LAERRIGVDLFNKQKTPRVGLDGLLIISFQ